jgi:hypothetical protein
MLNNQQASVLLAQIWINITLHLGNIGATFDEEKN